MAKKIQVDLQARTDKANKDIKKFADKSKSSFSKVKRSSASASKSMAAGWKKAALAVAGVTAGIIAVVAAIKVAKRAFAAFTEVAKVGDDFHKMSLRLGETTEELSALGYAADISGASIETVEKALKYATQQMNDFANGTGEAKKTFEALGITVTTTDGRLKSSITILKELADKISKMDDAGRQAAYAAEIFGMRAGPQLLPLLKLGSRGIEELMKKAEELGLVISTEFAGKSAAFIDSMRDWKGAIDGIKNVIVESLLPAITDIVEGTTSWIKANKEFIQVDLKNYIVGIVNALKTYISTIKGLKAIWDKFHPGTRIEEIAGRAVGNLLKKAGEEVEDTFKGSEEQIRNTIKALKEFEKETAGIKFPPVFGDIIKIPLDKKTLDELEKGIISLEEVKKKAVMVEKHSIKEAIISLEGLSFLRKEQQEGLQKLLKTTERLLKKAKRQRITSLWDPKYVKKVKVLSAIFDETREKLEKLEKPIGLDKWLAKGIENIKSYVKGQKEITLSTEEYIKRAKEAAAIEYPPPFDWEKWILPAEIFETYDEIGKAAVSSATDATFAMHDLMKEVEQGMKDTAAGVEKIKQDELDIFISNIDKILEAERAKSEELGILAMQEQRWKEEGWERESEIQRERIAANENWITQFRYGLEQAQAHAQSWGETMIRIGEQIGEVWADNLTDNLWSFIDGTKSAKQALQDFAIDFLKWISKMIIKQMILNALMKMGGPFGGVATVGAGAMMQAGGPVTAGQPYMVGEAGRELFVPSTNGNIIPNNKTDQMMQQQSPELVANIINVTDVSLLDNYFTTTRGQKVIVNAIGANRQSVRRRLR